MTVLSLLLAACGASSTPPSEPPAAPPPPEPVATAKVAEAPAPPRELPRGGREIFPTYRLVGFCGTPGAPALGLLDGDLAKRAKSIEDYGTKYAKGRKPLPVFELIAVVVQGVPGPDGKWRNRVDDAVVDRYLKAAREAKALLLLDIQPGQSDFMSELQHFEKYLAEPDVGVALDPEWSVKPKQRPGHVYGHTTGPVIDEVATYLAGIVKEHDLPEKVLVFHQLARFIVSEEEAVKPHPGLAIVKVVDGLGPPGAKVTTYGVVVKTMTAGVHPGFKLFFDEDTRNHSILMTPRQVLALRPEPEYVLYE